MWLLAILINGYNLPHFANSSLVSLLCAGIDFESENLLDFDLPCEARKFPEFYIKLLQW